MGNEQKPGAVKVPPLPEAPVKDATWPGIKPPTLFSPEVPPPPLAGPPPVAGATGVPVPLPNEPTPVEPTDAGRSEDDATIEELIEEIANRDVRLAELENDNIELRLAYQRRSDELSENQGLLEDSQARVELLERRLAEAMEAQQELLMRQARREVHEAQNALHSADAGKLAAAEREIAAARSIIGNLEHEVGAKEAKLADLKAEIAALRNILRNVDARAIEAAKRRMGG